MNSLLNSSAIRFIAIISFVSSHFLATAVSEAKPTLFDQLADVNAQWNFHADLAPTNSLDFATDIDLIQFHLEQVVSILRNESTDLWTEEQTKNRLHLLDVLEAYAARKVFPTNLYHTKRTPYFIDDFGVHCAVGYLIAQSGNEELANKISNEFNYDYIEDIQSAELLVWAKKHGFTVDELKWIQPGYQPSQPLVTIGNGTNGKVDKVYADNSVGRLLILGDFDSIDMMPCLNIGVFQNDQLSCFGGGLAGTVNDVFVTVAGVYVAGELESNGTNYPLALYDGTSWQFFAIPTRDGAIGTNTFISGQTQMEVTVQHSSLNGSEEIWLFSAPNNWELEAKVNGPILDIEASGIGRIFAGHFDSVTRYSAVPETFAVTNVVVKENWVDNWFGLGSEISDTVKAIKMIGSGIYFGGTCSSDPNESNVCLTRYMNGSLQSVLLHEQLGDPNASSINDMAFLNGTQVIIGGNFSYNPVIGEYGQSLASYDLISGYMDGLAILDDAVNSLAYQNNDLFIGGDFKYQYTNQPINHLARINSTIGLEEEQFKLEIYPNPFQNVLTIEGFEGSARYSLFDLSGKMLRDNQLISDGQLDLSELENGVYVLQIETDFGQFVERIVKSDLN